MSQPEITILLPCLNEAKSLAFCISEAIESINNSSIDAEILIADNGSTDGSLEIARSLGVRIIKVENKGYGAAIRGGIEAALGEKIVLADADGSYDLGDIPNFINALEIFNADLVIGNRFKGGIEARAMPKLHRYLGNPVLSFLGRLFYRTEIRDFHCGMRAFKKTSVSKISFSTHGMEFASEIIVKSLMSGLKVVEIPTKLRKDLRGRPSHLNTWRDGWAHLSFLMILSPKWVLLIPGLTSLIFGATVTIFLLIGPLKFYSLTLDTQSLIYSSSFILSGILCLNIWKISDLFREKLGFKRDLKAMEMMMSRFVIKSNLVFSTFGMVCSFALIFVSIWYWKLNSFGNLNTEVALRISVSGSLMLALSFQGLFFNLFWGFVKSLNRDNSINWEEV